MRSLSRTTFSSVGWSHAAVVVLACIILLSASQPVTATPTSYRQQRRASPVSQHSNGPLDRRQGTYKLFDVNYTAMLEKKIKKSIDCVCT